MSKSSVEKILLIARGGDLKAIQIVRIETSRLDEEYLEGKENGIFTSYEEYKKYIIQREADSLEKHQANWMSFTEKEWIEINKQLGFIK